MPERSAARHRTKGLLTRIRHSLLTRLLAVCVAVAAASIAATAWIASASTSGSIRQQYNDDLAATSRIYGELLGYAATHRSWNSAELRALAKELHEQTNRDILLTANDRAIFYSDNNGARPPAGSKETAVVDPLHVTAVAGDPNPASGIDPRAVGPFKLSDADAAALGAAADTATKCLRQSGIDAAVRSTGTGRITIRPTLQLEFPARAKGCLGASGLAPTKAERQSAVKLVGLANQCLTGLQSAPVGGEILDPEATRELIAQQGPQQKECVESAWRQMVAEHVAPPALLWVSGATTLAQAERLPGRVRIQIALAGVAILLAAAVLCALAATRILRPVRALTAAARQVGKGDRSTRVATRDAGQIGELATAFNRMSRELDVAEDRRRRMVSDIAHELRTPLGNLRAWLEAAQDGVVKLDEDLAGSLLEESLLVQRVVEDLQELALADAGKIEFHPEPMDAAALIAQVAAAHRVAAAKAGLTLIVEADGPVQLTADVGRLRQAVGNLVSNAIRYTPEGSVTIRAGRENGEVVICVEDTGVGLREDERDRVFERFWRAEQSRSRASGGSGLGLAITRHLIEAQGGNVSVRSEYGRGSAFTIRIPAGE